MSELDKFLDGFTTTVEEAFKMPSNDTDPYKLKEYHINQLQKRFGECAVRERHISIERVNDSIYECMKLTAELLVLDFDQFKALIKIMPMELIQKIKQE